MVIYIKFKIAKETDAFYLLLIRIYLVLKLKKKRIFAKTIRNKYKISFVILQSIQSVNSSLTNYPVPTYDNVC